ncbi:hypothetical protein FE257_003900 [Aspergillus nanangensis]|uniref:Autophagy-related protein 27 n=1 Tax=Aspergillus nanangensis TaxID=2582783 RepID=A0AAD4GN96_ASPNN|nr:hypothetical protein FE257_003900 [Aspergillus nanangensis]
MRIPSSLLLSSLLPSIVAASGFDCEKIRVDGINYNLGPLGGVHEVYHVDETEEYVTNTTYVLNICNILKSAANRDGLKCGTSKNICGFQYKNYRDRPEKDGVAFPIAGLDPMGHGSKDPEVTRLKQMDPDREGLLVKLAGGEFYNQDRKKKEARAMIEFQCDPDRSGLEGLVNDKEEEGTNDEDGSENERRRVRVREEDGEDGDGSSEDGDGSSPDEGQDRTRSLTFKSFGSADDDSYVLKLDWRTRYACDHYKDDKDDASSNHWGFFTWVILILFLSIAAYLVFGSWLNYNRYGARGWDLLPHGDTIRDVPYLFQDWLRRVINTFQGAGSRGGYSAV